MQCKTYDIILTEFGSCYLVITSKEHIFLPPEAVTDMGRSEFDIMIQSSQVVWDKESVVQCRTVQYSTGLLRIVPYSAVKLSVQCSTVSSTVY